MIHFFCAFMAEAQPIKDHFAIHDKVQQSLFPVFIDRAENYSLTITGAGRINAAAAAAYHYSKITTARSDIWLNIGIAGHKDLSIGSCVLIDKITTESGDSWYPQILFSTKQTRRTCLTLDRPCSDYQEHLFDMELAGLYPIWMRFAISELCHSIKVVSDNTENNYHQFDKTQCNHLIKNQITIIERILGSLIELQKEFSKNITVPEAYHQCLDTFHFSQTQQNQLKKLLYRWMSFYDAETISDILLQTKSSKDFLAKLELELTDRVGIN